MALLEREGDRSFAFAGHEVTGAVGDSATVLPLVVSIAAITEFSLAHVLLGFAAFQVVWGVYYGLPVSVEPMKALAALLLAGSITVAEFRVAGLLAGGVLIVAGAAGALDRIERLIGQPVVRGVQLAVALVLLRTGYDLAVGSPELALLGLGVAAGAVLVGVRRGSALLVLALALALAAVRTGSVDPALPVPFPWQFDHGLRAGLTTRALEATGAQLAMTVGNAAVAASLLLSDYFDADVPPDELAGSMGVTNLLAVPLGAIPMCHGSGGIAGKYAFGARTAGANLVLGGFYAVAALLLVNVVANVPMALVGVVLALVAAQLARTSLATESLPFTVAVGVLGVVTNVGVAFLVGLAFQQLARLARGRG